MLCLHDNLGLQGDLGVDDLEAAQRAVEQGGGVITGATFAFPGGRRFHFADPNGLELAVLKVD